MENSKKKLTVDTVDKDGKPLGLAIKTPGYKTLQEAQMIYSIELTSLIKLSTSGDSQLFSREQLEKHLGDMGIWTMKDARQFLELQMELRAMELQLQQGGIKVSEARKIAIQMKAKRGMLLTLYNSRSQFDGITIESMAEAKKFKFLITRCTVLDVDGSLFFDSIEDYDVRQGERAAIDAATVLAGYLYGYDKDTESHLVENQWLKKFEFADDDGRLINEEGHLIDIHGSLVNGDGRFVDKDGNLVDSLGRMVDEDGDFVISEAKPFIDDRKGVAIKEKKAKATKKKTRSTKKK